MVKITLKSPRSSVKTLIYRISWQVLEPLPLDLQAALAHVLPGDAGDASLKALQCLSSVTPCCRGHLKNHMSRMV
jgi:hypothetical protein